MRSRKARAFATPSSLRTFAPEGLGPVSDAGIVHRPLSPPEGRTYCSSVCKNAHGEFTEPPVDRRDLFFRSPVQPPCDDGHVGTDDELHLDFIGRRPALLAQAVANDVADRRSKARQDNGTRAALHHCAIELALIAQV